MDISRAPGITAGTVIGNRYTVESLLGRGGMASVYRATDVPLGRSVALKIFTADTESAAGLGRESSEIRLLASLNHHALVTLFDASIDRGDGSEYSFLVMELVEGPTLGERLAEGPVAEIDVAQLLVDLAEALHVVHGNGVVHRDVKPANILLNPSSLRGIEFRAKLSDFGIAYLIDSTRLTVPGTIIGTAAYLSPEQARGVAPGAPADIYSLGLVVLEALTGNRAFEGSMIESLSARLVSDPVIPASLGADWSRLLTRMTHRTPEARPTALEVVELARALERDLYAGGAGDTGETRGDLTATQAFTPEATRPFAPEATQPFVPTATQPFVPEAVPSDDATAPLDPPTRVLPAATANSAAPYGSNDATTVLEPAAGSAPAARPRAKRPVALRAVLAGIAVLVVVAVGWFALDASTGGGDAAPATPTPLPTNEGVLGTHLDELLESVTP